MNRASLFDGLRRRAGKSYDYFLRSLFGQINYSGYQLAKMGDHAGIIPTVIAAAKNKGVRWDEKDIRHFDTKSLNQDIVFCRGTASRTLDRLHKRLMGQIRRLRNWRVRAASRLASMEL